MTPWRRFLRWLGVRPWYLDRAEKHAWAFSVFSTRNSCVCRACMLALADGYEAASY